MINKLVKLATTFTNSLRLSFQFCHPPGTDGSILSIYSPYLHAEGRYELVPQFTSPLLQGAQESINLVTILVVDVLNRHPIFFVQIKPPAEMPYDSKREEANIQMR